MPDDASVNLASVSLASLRHRVASPLISLANILFIYDPGIKYFGRMIYVYLFWPMELRDVIQNSNSVAVNIQVLDNENCPLQTISG